MGADGSASDRPVGRAESDRYTGSLWIRMSCRDSSGERASAVEMAPLVLDPVFLSHEAEPQRPVGLRIGPTHSTKERLVDWFSPK